MHTVPGQHHPSGTADIECTFSQRVLQFALNEYATDNFTHQVFVSGYDGLWAVGESMELVLADGMAAVIIRLQANFRLWAGQWQMLQTSRPVEIRLGVQFRVVNQELFITFQESDVTIPDVGALQQVVRELLQFITANLFNKPLLSLPLQIDLAGRHERASDSTQLAMTSLHVEDGSVTIALQLVQNDVPYPPFFHDTSVNQSFGHYSRSRALLLVRRGIAEYTNQHPKRAAAYFVRAALQADPSYELAWLWLAGVVQSERERKYCLERVVAINPGNLGTRRALDTMSSVVAVVPNVDTYPFSR